jgi:hypothetical protein
VIGILNNLDQNHKIFFERFFDIWPTSNPNTGKPYTLREALDAAAVPDPAHGLPGSVHNKQIVIYGCPDLTFK